PLLIRIMDREDVGVGLLVLGAQVAARRVGAKAAGVDAHHIDRRLALYDPFGELPSGTAGSRHAKAVTFVEPEVRELPGWPDDRATVRRIGNRPIVDFFNPDLSEGRHACDGRFNVRPKALQVLLEQLELGLLVRAV